MKTISDTLLHCVEIIMHNASRLEHFHNNVGEKKKLSTNTINTFLLACKNTNQYIQHERWLPPRNEPQKSELKPQIGRYKDVKRATL